MNRLALAALAAFVLAAVGLVVWMLLADPAAPVLADEAAMEPAQEAARQEPRGPTAPTSVQHKRLPRLKPVNPAEGVPAATLEGLESEGNIDAEDRLAVARWMMPRIRLCLADEPGGDDRMVARVHVLNNGAAEALLNRAMVIEGPGDMTVLQVCVERAINGKPVPVGALAIDALVSFPVSRER